MGRQVWSMIGDDKEKPKGYLLHGGALFAVPLLEAGVELLQDGAQLLVPHSSHLGSGFRLGAVSDFKSF